MSWVSADGNRRVHVAGSPAFMGSAADTPAEALANAILDFPDASHRLRNVANHWVAVVEDRQRGVVRFASDPLGIYPLFLGEDTSPVFGSDVWELTERGLLSSRRLNYRSIANWLLFDADFSGGALFEGVRRLPPGAVVSIRPGPRRVDDYCGFDYGAEPMDAVTAGEMFCDFIRDNLLASVRSYPGPLAAGLSGGNDSRLLVALAVEHELEDLVVWTVEWDGAEAEAAERAARALEVERLRVPIDGSLFDFYEDWSGFLASGFPQGNFVVNEVVQRHTGSRSQIHGYIGGLVMGGRFDPPDTPDPDQLSRTLRDRDELEGSYVFRPAVRRAVQKAGAATFRRFLETVAPQSRRALAANLYHRQRFFIPPTFLSYGDTARTFLPFYSHAVLDLLLRYRIMDGDGGLYPTLFRRRFPHLTSVPTDRELRKVPLHTAWSGSRHWKREARRLAFKHLAGGSPAVERFRAVPRLALHGLGHGAAGNWVRLLSRIDRLERRLRRQGMQIDWDELVRDAPDGSAADGP